MSAMTTAPPEFAQLCAELYGDVLDPDQVWEVAKRSPDQVDVAARNARIRRNVERTSNAIGITAGGLGLAGALKDKRLKHGGRVGRALRATGRRMPKVLGRIGNKKVQAALATGAVATQVANLGGDALIAGTLGENKPAVAKAIGLGSDIRLMAGNVRTLWNPNLAHGVARPKPKAPVPMTSVGGPRGAAARTAQANDPKAAQPTAPTQPQTRQGVKDARARQQGLAQDAQRRRRYQGAGRDVADALSTTTGKLAVGTVAVGGAAKLRPTGGSYDPYYGYGKRDDDVVFRGEFSKFDDDKMQAFGWASIVTKDGSPVVDKQGDYISIEDLEEAAYTYVHKSRVGGDMHKRDGDAPHHVSDMIESIVFTPEKIRALELPENFPEGWWVGYQIHDPQVWAEVRKRGRTGFSIHGRGIRKDHALDELMGYR